MRGIARFRRLDELLERICKDNAGVSQRLMVFCFPMVQMVYGHERALSALTRRPLAILPAANLPDASLPAASLPDAIHPRIAPAPKVAALQPRVRSMPVFPPLSAHRLTGDCESEAGFTLARRPMR